MKKIAVIAAALLLSSCSSLEKTGYYKGYELPPYSVSEKIDPIELREYKSQLVAEVRVSGSRKEAAEKGFRILANYIFGDNSVKTDVAMTTPVTQKPSSEKIAMTTPVTQIVKGEDWVVQFGMPKQYTLETLPKANDERISFSMSQPKTVAVIMFSGLWSDSLFNENKAKLDDFIVSRKLTSVADASYAYYDDPFTFPWNRRNEIMIEVKN